MVEDQMKNLLGNISNYRSGIGQKALKFGQPNLIDIQ